MGLLIPLALLLLHSTLSTHGEICTSDICNYEFEIRYAQTMTYSHPVFGTYDVKLNSTGNGYIIVENDSYRKLPDPLIGKSVSLNEVIAADGYQRTITTINGEFPGPTIEVMRGARVVVKVINKLHSDDITIHWHGLLMRGVTWMDGVPDVSQCPIPSGHTFTYMFPAEPAGTHWYHSHVTRQRLYGLNGVIVVHDSNSPLPSPLSYHTLSIGDWFRVDGHTHHILDPTSVDIRDRGTGRGLYAEQDRKDILADGVTASGLLWQSGLINGRGRADPLIKSPLTVFRVSRGQRYRFRVANVGSDFALKLSIDRHLLTVIATDGYDMEPVTAEYIILSVGETVDFEMEANQLGPRFWMRARTLKDPLNEEVHGVRAIIHYEGSIGDCDPASEPRPCTQAVPCLVFNCPFQRYPASHNRTCLSINQVKTLVSQNHLNQVYGLDQSNVREIHLNMGAKGGSNMNGIRYTKPTAPPFQGESATDDCEGKCTDPTQACVCHHRYQLRYMEPVRFIVSNFARNGVDFHHPFHMHGHHFAVLHVGYPPMNQITTHRLRNNEDVLCEGNDPVDGNASVCRQPHWNPLRDPPVYDTSRVALKNTLPIPSGGYAVVQIMADNPGFWLVHCHMAAHQANGMTVLLEEAPQRIKAPPPGFPTCYNYEPTDKEFDDYLATGDVVEPNGENQYIIDECPAESSLQNPRQQNPRQQNPPRQQANSNTNHGATCSWPNTWYLYGPLGLKGDGGLALWGSKEYLMLCTVVYNMLSKHAAHLGFNVLLGEIFNIINTKK